MQSARSLLAKEVDLFNHKLNEYLYTRIGLLNHIMRFLVKRKGKQIRPLLVLLSAKLTGTITEATYRAAGCVEIVHVATLIHDDVVDQAMERRGFFSINALWKNKIAVLAGDYLLSQGLLLALQNKDYECLEMLSIAVKQMSEAELLQLEKARNLSATEDIYFDIIKGKTASLMASACALGTLNQATSHPDLTRKMYDLGMCIGLAFQIKDDLLDYSPNWIGKPKMQDLRDKKLTLPLLYTLNEVERKDKKFIIHTIKSEKAKEKGLQRIIHLCHSSGGIQKAEAKMHAIKTQAFTLLHTFPKSEVRDCFAHFLEEMILRTY